MTMSTQLETQREAPPAEPDLKEKIADYWNWRSGDFERRQGVRNQVQKRAWLAFLGTVAGDPPRTVLDVGTGTGFLALLLAELGHRCKALDLSPAMLEQARQTARQRGLELCFDVGDAESLPEADAAYDVVISRNVLWTLPDPERALCDWRRVLKPGGRLVIVDGDWFDKRLSYRLQRFAGNLWLALTRFTNPWAAERRLRRDYASRLPPDLPMMRPGNREKMPKLVAACGFADVRTLPMREVDAAEKADKTLMQRLIFPHRFFAVVATAKPSGRAA
ncbi:MAG TPA: class I SAM-dependent methyltransferase [Thermoanaerobaculia bacterium]|nr:class I SAM-dependent methyltransferase [Thermoanaerobaculia bacterium]